MFEITVVAKVVAEKDTAEALKIELEKLVEPTRNEEGCIEYRLHRDNQDPAVFLFFETWRDKAALDGHMDSPHFKKYVQATASLIADKVVHLMTAIA